MATSIGQYAPVFLPGEPPSLTEKPGRPHLQGCKELDTTKACVHRCKTFSACSSSDPVRVEREGGTAAWLVGILGSTKCAGTWTASTTGVMALSVFFRASCSWQSEGLFGQFFPIAPPVQAHRGLPCLGSFSVVQHVRHIEGPPWLGSYP